MPINFYNSNPRSLPFIHQIIGNKLIVDCGSMDELAPVWKPIIHYADFLGFDPEIHRSSDQSGNVTSLDKALDSEVKQKKGILQNPNTAAGFNLLMNMHAGFLIGLIMRQLMKSLCKLQL